MCVLHMGFHYLLNNHHIAFDLNISTVWWLIWGPFGGHVGFVWASWPSWRRLGAFLGRPDAILTFSNFA